MNKALLLHIIRENKKKDKFDFGLVKKVKPEKYNIFAAIIKPMDSTEGRK